MKTVLITGGAGFIGAHMTKRFASKGYKVIAFDHKAKNTLGLLGYDKSENVTFVEGDILDAPKLLEIMKGADIVIHAAAVVGVDVVNRDQLTTMQTNIFGTFNVLEAARQLGIKDRVIIFSTSEIFGGMAYGVKETDPVHSGPPGEARWGYAISKVAGEHFAHGYHKRFGVPVAIVRPFNIYGPGQTMNGAMKMFISKALENEDININGDGSPIRAWCYVEDFVDCIEKCIENPAAINQSFNVGNARTGITVLGLAQRIIQLLGSSSKIIHGKPLAEEIQLRIPSTEKAKEILGFEAKVDLDEGILKTAESVKKELLIKKQELAHA